MSPTIDSNSSIFIVIEPLSKRGIKLLLIFCIAKAGFDFLFVDNSILFFALSIDIQAVKHNKRQQITPLASQMSVGCFCSAYGLAYVVAKRRVRPLAERLLHCKLER
jgi:hypothetical protein